MTLLGINGILNPYNYLLTRFATSSTSPKKTVQLGSLIANIYCFGEDFVTFKYKNIGSLLLKLNIHCGYIENEKIFFVTDKKKSVHDFTKSDFISIYNKTTNLASCTSKLINSNILTLTNNNSINYNILYPSDFYIKNGKSLYTPYAIVKVSANMYNLKFRTDIIKKSSDPIYLCTHLNCKSTDALGNSIKADDSLEIENLLPTMPISLSITSYINGILGLALTFNNGIQRYDSDDFCFTIRGKHYNAKGRESYTKGNIIYFFIYDLYNFDYTSTPIIILPKRSKNYYTLDENLALIKMPIKISSNYLYGITSKLDAITTFGTATLEIEFNDYLLETTMTLTGELGNFNNLKEKIFSPTILEHSPNLNLINPATLSLYIENFALIYFHTNSKIILDELITYNIETSSTKKISTTKIDLSPFDFLNHYKNIIKYIEVVPLEKLQSYTYTLPLSSLEIPTNLVKGKDIICLPENQGDDWTLLGEDIYFTTTLLVNKSYKNFNYGFFDHKTHFFDSLYIKNTSDSPVFEDIIINFTNIKGETLEISLDDGFSFNFENCEFKNVIIL